MDEFIKESLQNPAMVSQFGIWKLLASLTLTLFLCLVLTYFYRETHRGLSYSVSLTHTIIIMGVTISLIMVIIGSNIARAFALVGALSIIRFRNPIKDSRDVGFIFMAMAIGMATGTGFYLAAVVFALFACAMVYFMHRFNIGAKTINEVLLRVHLPESLDYHSVFNDVFFRSLHDHSLLSVETVRGGTLLELVYAIQFKKNVREAAFLDELRVINSNNKVALFTGQENVNI
jgi:hypothetical protein